MTESYVKGVLATVTRRSNAWPLPSVPTFLYLTRGCVDGWGWGGVGMRWSGVGEMGLGWGGGVGLGWGGYGAGRVGSLGVCVGAPPYEEVPYRATVGKHGAGRMR